MTLMPPPTILQTALGITLFVQVVVGVSMVYVGAIVAMLRRAPPPRPDSADTDEQSREP